MDAPTTTAIKPPPRDSGPVTRPTPAPRPQAAPQPEPGQLESPKTVWPLRVQLATPIEILATDGSQQAYITEMEFRQPTGADLIACGIPVSVDYRTNSPSIDATAMATMMARLSGKPPFYFQKNMDSKDFITCAWKLRDFFLPNFDQLI